MLVKYDLKMPHAIFSGEDALDKIHDILAENHVQHLAVFTDKGIRSAGLLDLPMARVEESGVDTVVLDDLPAEPSYEEAQKLVDQCKACGAFIMAVGGGTKNRVWMQMVADAMGEPLNMAAVTVGARKKPW